MAADAPAIIGKPFGITVNQQIKAICDDSNITATKNNEQKAQ